MNIEKTTKSNEDYIEAIYVHEIEHQGNPMKSTDLASEMKVSKAAISKAMHELKEKGLIDKSDYGKIFLTNLGREIARKVYLKHETIHNFLIALGVSSEKASVECCLIEHIVSDETVERMAFFLSKNK